MTTFLAWVGGIAALIFAVVIGAIAWFYWVTSGFTKWN